MSQATDKLYQFQTIKGKDPGIHPSPPKGIDPTGKNWNMPVPLKAIYKDTCINRHARLHYVMFETVSGN